jgi:hypothetical protein
VPPQTAAVNCEPELDEARAGHDIDGADDSDHVAPKSEDKYMPPVHDESKQPTEAATYCPVDEEATACQSKLEALDIVHDSP